MIALANRVASINDQQERLTDPIQSSVGSSNASFYQ